MHKLAYYILDMCNYIDEKYPSLFYFVPECYLRVALSIVQAFIRLNPGSLPFLWPELITAPLSFSRDLLLKVAVTLILNHFVDEHIPSPDLQDFFLVSLEPLLECPEIVKKLEAIEISQKKLIPSLLLSLKVKSPAIVTRLLLYLIKGKSYNDIKYAVPILGSDYFKEQFTITCSKDAKLRETFLNSFFNHTNDLISNLKLSCAQNMDVNSSVAEKKAACVNIRDSCYVLYRMFRVLEAIISLIPFVFLERNGIFKQRNSDVCMIVIREAIAGQMGSYFANFDATTQKLTKTIETLLSPIAGIYLCLSKNEGKDLATVEECIVKADGFEKKLMPEFLDILKGKGSQEEFAALEKIVNSLDNFIEEHCSPVNFRLTDVGEDGEDKRRAAVSYLLHQPY